jgi:hypothetical protein
VAVARLERNPFIILIGKPEGRRSIRRSKWRYEGNTKMGRKLWIAR